MLALGAVSGGFGGKIRYRVRGDWYKYVVVAMDPGERKSAVFKAVFGPVYAAEKEAIEKARPVIAAAKAELSMKEALLRQIKNAAVKQKDTNERANLEREAKELAVELAEFKIPVEPVFVVDDETLESLGKTLIEQNGRLLQAAAEGTAFEIAGGRYADNENFDVYLKAHDGDYFKIGRISRGRNSHESPALTCGFAVQPDVLYCLGRSAKARGRGFLARWLYSIPAPMVGTRKIRPTPVSATVKNTYAAVITAIWEIKIPDEPAVVLFSPDADDKLAAFEGRVETAPRVLTWADVSTALAHLTGGRPVRHS
jgi:hypothetical protein